MPSYKDSPKPLRKSDPNPIFKNDTDEGYVIKAMNPIEQQRHADGSLHSMTRRSSVQAPGIDESLYLGDDKMDKSVEAHATRDNIDVDEIVKAYMEKGAPTAPRLPPIGKSEDDEDEQDESDIQKNKAKLGSGARFKKLSHEAAEGGAKDPDAVAAAIGRKKYGKKKFAKLGAAGKKSLNTDGEDEKKSYAAGAKIAHTVGSLIPSASKNPA